ncbi:GNAT family N-acetyltransferase [Paenibacillus sp. SC116]|uniref:GNAT family N-acetyltransferase n=1 Tax=Paenibacillus sp. SC116 TaxID=2968986 RepID=UPI00215AF8A4|nr:GNAT family N-acetyltransferase [Paenibacillus sp. SC116]MCR8843279.1 GNAT family N-acetyltransferase [Paenibacillus sp. SC116]
MIHKLMVDNEAIAKQMLDVQIPSYQIEAELIDFYDIPQLKDTVETVMASNETFVGYFVEDELAAFISYTDEGQVIDICRLVVHPNYFRKGIARKLVAHVLDEIAKYKKVIVSTGAKNAPAKQLYEQCGFQEMKDIEVAPNVFITLFERN